MAGLCGRGPFAQSRADRCDPSRRCLPLPPRGGVVGALLGSILDGGPAALERARAGADTRSRRAAHRRALGAGWFRQTAEMTTMKAVLRKFIVDNFLYNQQVEFSDDDSL